MAPLLKVLLSAALATAALAHSHVNNLVINGVYWQGYDPTSYPYETNPPTVVGWTAADLDNGFVSPSSYQSPDIICHKSATPAGGHALAAAGDSISIQWAIAWPDSHHGPVLDYLAACNGPCEAVDKTTLSWFKIDAVGWLSGADPGVWASDALIADNSTWLVQIPPTLKAGNYVLRHEIVALHSAASADGAQNYPQCFNLAVSGGGDLVPAGVLGEALYAADDPGVLYNIYTSVEDYVVPGPTLYSGFASSVVQSSSVATVTSSAVVAAGSAATTTTKTTTTTTTGVATTSTGQSSSSGASSTVKTTATTTSAVGQTTTAAAGGAGQTLYGQCGGTSWSGATSCVGGACTTLNAYYAQCVPT